jgi:hypothetical protein
MRIRVAIALFAVLIAATAVAWRYQSEIIGSAQRFYLQRVAAQEEQSGDLRQRRQTVARLHRQLLVEAAPDSLVPELFDFVTQLSGRTASGEISLAWAAYLYTSHLREALSRATGAPRKSSAQLAAEIQDGVEFFYLQKRPDATGVRVKDLWDDGESFTVEEIEQAARNGVDLTRGE